MQFVDHTLPFVVSISFFAGIAFGTWCRQRVRQGLNRSDLADRQARCREALDILLLDEIRAASFVRPHSQHYDALMEMVSSALETGEVTMSNIDSQYMITIVLALACAGLELSSRWERLVMTELHPNIEWRASFATKSIPTKSVKALLDYTSWYLAMRHAALQSVVGVSTRFGRD